MDAMSRFMLHAALTSQRPTSCHLPVYDCFPMSCAQIPRCGASGSLIAPRIRIWSRRSRFPLGRPLVALISFVTSTSGEFHIVAIESRSFTVVQVAPTIGRFDSLSDDAKKAFVERAAEALLNLKDSQHSWTLPVPNRLAEGVQFSTNPDR